MKNKTKIVFILMVAAMVIAGLLAEFTNYNISEAGDFAFGYFAAGQFAMGVFSAGMFSVGIFSAGLFSVGIFSASIFNLAIYGIGFYVLAMKRKELKNENG